jgi:hypothetical protein
MVSWPTLIAWRVWTWLSWPWQVRQMKAMGFRRVGWMTWETGPEQPDEATLTRFGLRPLPELPDGVITLAVRGCQGISPEMAAELAEGIRRLGEPEEL